MAPHRLITDPASNILALGPYLGAVLAVEGALARRVAILGVTTLAGHLDAR